MHDTPARMYAKGTLKGVVPWRDARAFFSTRLQRRLVEEALVRHVASTDVSISRHAAIAMVSAWHSMGGALTHLGAAGADAGPSAGGAPPAAAALWGEQPAAASAGGAAAGGAGERLEALAAAQAEADRSFLSWAESPAGRAQIAMELKALRSHAASRLVADMLGTAEGKEGLLKGLQAALGTDTALATQLRSLLQRPSV
jgi:acetyl-CoA carboxylase/biotin carboxylase 1